MACSCCGTVTDTVGRKPIQEFDTSGCRISSRSYVRQYDEPDALATDGGEEVLSRPLPDALGRELGAVYDAAPVETYGDWLETMVAAMDREPTVDDMCCVDDARHEVETDGEVAEYICIVDPLMVPFIRDEPAVIRSAAPGTDAEVTARVDADGELTVDPETAVVSFGAASTADDDVEDPVERGYVALCEYGHAFPDRESYERWAASTETVTTSLAYEDATVFAAAVAERLV